MKRWLQSAPKVIEECLYDHVASVDSVRVEDGTGGVLRRVLRSVFWAPASWVLRRGAVSDEVLRGTAAHPEGVSVGDRRRARFCDHLRFAEVVSWSLQSRDRWVKGSAQRCRCAPVDGVRRALLRRPHRWYDSRQKEAAAQLQPALLEDQCDRLRAAASGVVPVRCAPLSSLRSTTGTGVPLRSKHRYQSTPDFPGKRSATGTSQPFGSYGFLTGTSDGGTDPFSRLGAAQLKERRAPAVNTVPLRSKPC